MCAWYLCPCDFKVSIFMKDVTVLAVYVELGLGM